MPAATTPAAGPSRFERAFSPTVHPCGVDCRRPAHACSSGFKPRLYSECASCPWATRRYGHPSRRISPNQRSMPPRKGCVSGVAGAARAHGHGTVARLKLAPRQRNGNRSGTLDVRDALTGCASSNAVRAYLVDDGARLDQAQVTEARAKLTHRRGAQKHDVPDLQATRVADRQLAFTDPV